MPLPPILFPAVATFLAGGVLVISALLRDRRLLFFAVMFAGVAAGAWLHHCTKLSGFWIAALVVVMLYAVPLERIRLTGALIGGAAAGLVLDELFLALVSGAPGP